MKKRSKRQSRASRSRARQQTRAQVENTARATSAPQVREDAEPMLNAVGRQVLSSTEHSLEGKDALSGGEISLSRAKMLWLFGEWQMLAELGKHDLSAHPERDRLALFAASGYSQLGEREPAEKWIRKALEWGCSQRLVAQVLIAGVHNTLGRVSALKKDEPRTARHFGQATAVGASEQEAAMVRHARSVKEMARLGLLPQSASLVHEAYAERQATVQRPLQQLSDQKVFESELELLRGELSLAQSRQQILKAPQAATGDVSRNSTQGTAADDLAKKAVSQLGQDLWAAERSNYKRGGYFIEFGATDGVLLSNSWLLEKHFGWSGICAEPNPKFLEALRKNRTCHVSDACVSGETGDEVEFILADVYGSMAQYADRDGHGQKRSAYASKSENVVRMRTISLHDLLRKYDAPRDIDYLSIDTEGSELEILSAFPFDQWNIRLITVEHNFTEDRLKIRALLQGQGYVCTEMEWDDWYEKCK